MTTQENAPLSQYLQPVFAHRKLLVVVTLLTLGLGVAAGSAMPTSYVSSTSVLVYPVDPDPSSVLASDENRVDMATEIRLATSTAVTSSASELLAAQDINLPQDTLAAGVAASSPKESSILDISFAAASPGEAQAGADALADAYVRYRAELANSTKVAAEQAITDRIGVLTQRLNGLNPVATASVQAELEAQQATLADLSTLVVDATTVVDRASLPSAPRGLSALQLVVGSLAGGLVLGVIAAYAAAALRQTASSGVGEVATATTSGDRSPAGPAPATDRNEQSIDSATEPAPPTEPAHRSNTATEPAPPTEPAHRPNAATEPAPPAEPVRPAATAPAAADPATEPAPPAEPVRPAATAPAAADPAAVIAEPATAVAAVEQPIGLDETVEAAPAQDPEDERSEAIRQAVADYERGTIPAPGTDPQSTASANQDLPAAPTSVPAPAPTSVPTPTPAPAPTSVPAPVENGAEAVEPRSTAEAVVAPVLASPDMDNLIERLQELGRVGPVVGLTLGEEGAGTSIAVAFDLADALQSLGARVLLIEAAIDDPMLASLLSTEAAPGLNEVLGGEATLRNSVHSVGGLTGLDALTIGNVTEWTAGAIAGAPFERLLEEAKVEYHSILIIAGSADDTTTVPALARLTHGLIVGTARVAGSQLGDELRRQLTAIPAPVLEFVSETVVVERTDEAAVAVGSSM